MKRFQNFLGMFLVVVATAGLLVACGEEETECLSDNDCGDGQLCNFQTDECAFECEPGVADACNADETCEARENDEGAICVRAETPNNNNPVDTCETSADCEGEQVCEDSTCVAPCEVGDCAEGFACNVETGICETETGPTGDYRFIKVMDDTSAAGACDSPDPGSDILGVQLDTDAGTFWAEVENADGIITTDNDNADADAILDGMAPGLDGDCPEGAFSDSVVALGCGGDVIVEFRDNDQPVYFSAGDDITVFEYGATCPQGTADDEWLAEVCTTTSEDDVFEGTCNGVELGGGSGTLTVSVIDG